MMGVPLTYNPIPQLIIVQIESKQAIENIDDIAQVPGVDVLFIGYDSL